MLQIFFLPLLYKFNLLWKFGVISQEFSSFIKENKEMKSSAGITFFEEEKSEMI